MAGASGFSFDIHSSNIVFVMMSPKAIATLVSQMKPPLELQNDYSRTMWLLEQAAAIAMKVSIDEMVNPVRRTIGGYW